MTVARILGENGLVADRLPRYQYRQQQLDMARAVQRAFAAPHHLLVEAGTGVGKTFAYLVPAIQHVLRTGSRVVISTHTIALQEQLMSIDIPLMQSVFEQEFSAVLVKGRSNYLGIRRLARATGGQHQLFDTRREESELTRIVDWAYETKDGSRADLAPQPAPSVWERVCSDASDCMGRRCEHYKRCFYQRARWRAQDAQLLIVNHALLFSDLAVRKQGASILPDYDFVVLDEAHTVEDVAGDHLGQSVASTQVQHLLQTLYNPRTRKGLLTTYFDSNVAIKATEAARRAAQLYFDGLLEWRAERSGHNGRLTEPPPIENTVTGALEELRHQIGEMRKGLDDKDERRFELSSMIDRCDDLGGTLDALHTLGAKDWVYWVDAAQGRRRSVALCGRPIDIGPELREHLFGAHSSVVLTSATLTTGSAQPFAYIKQRVGLDEAEVLALGSPFDFRRQVKVIVRSDMPDPSTGPAFVRAACEAMQEYLVRSEGRAFVLFTSYNMMNDVAGRIESFIEEHDMTLLVQGTGASRSAMIETFRTTARAVLFGTDTFWSGVDVPGAALSNVIIVKLPFAAPNRPIIEARDEQIRARGGNPFMELHVPQAVLKFKQGFGRLIRSSEDRGLVVILDPRVVRKPYGRAFLKALPDCEIITEDGAARPAASNKDGSNDAR